MPAESFAIAAVVYRPADPIEDVLARAAQALAARGVRLGGVVQHDVPGPAEEPPAMELEDLAGGTRFALSQALGAESAACRLDLAALAQASALVREAIDGGAELLVINKFGGQEAAGAGLRAEMAAAALAGVPLLTAVGERFLADWQSFTGGGATLLPPEVDAILAWWSALPARPRK